MLFERIESKGLAHNSYLLGVGKEALVVDPRRDCEDYVQRTARQGLRLRYILETHRNEDYVIGSVGLAERTGAEIWHADAQAAYRYGQPVEDGQTWRLGGYTLRAISAPGHTAGSMAYLLSDPNGAPWALFTGDALFAGEVGRTDLAGPENTLAMAALLHETLFERLLPLGDELLALPAHGAGSACGAAIDDRPVTTLGFERRRNPRLQESDRAKFVAEVGRQLEVPPYFRRMEQLNLVPEQVLGPLPAPTPLAPREFAALAKDVVVLDTRWETSFAAAHAPGSLSIWLAGVPSFAGWFLSYNKPILLVSEEGDVTEAVRYLARMGYDRVAGYLAGGLHSWLAAGLPVQTLPTVSVQAICERADSGEALHILDVRSQGELDDVGAPPNSQHIHLTQLPQRMNEVPRDRTVYVFCGSGLRSMIAASLLRNAGWERLSVILGGFAGWRSVRCPIERPLTEEQLETQPYLGLPR